MGALYRFMIINIKGHTSPFNGSDILLTKIQQLKPEKAHSRFSAIELFHIERVTKNKASNEAAEK